VGRKRLLLVVALLVGLGSLDQGPATAAQRHTITFDGFTFRVKDGRGNLGQCWSPSRVSTTGGVLRIQSGNGCGGGVGMTQSRTYGNWRVRYRMDAGAGVKYGILLWPASGSRPEIDFAEGSKHDPGRNEVTATYHPAPGCQGCTQWHHAVDMTQWHTLGVQWTPNGFTFTLDGKAWAHIGAHTSKPHHLSIQTWQFASGPPTTLEVSNVHVGP